jgi:hypothetical protein
LGLYENSGDIRNFVFNAGVDDTVDKLFSGVNDTADKLSLMLLQEIIIAAVIYTSDYALSQTFID